MATPFNTDTTSYISKPIQTLEWDKKIENNKQWFKDCVNYYISRTYFMWTTGPNFKNRMLELYDIYNNRFPTKWFGHVLGESGGTKNSQANSYPAKIRPVTIIRPALDLLYGEFCEKELYYNVINYDEDAYNEYLEGLTQALQQNVYQHIEQQMQQMQQVQQQQQQQVQAQNNGASPAIAQAQNDMQNGNVMQQQQQQQQIPMPDQIAEDFKNNYKDSIADMAQKWLYRALREYEIPLHFKKMFKDWLITGQSYSFKDIRFGTFFYEDIPPLFIDYDKSTNCDFIEDADWVVCRRELIVADVIDIFYDELSEEQIKILEQMTIYQNPQNIYGFSSTQYQLRESFNKIPVFHCQWKSRKKIKILHTIDEITGKPKEIELDESFPNSLIDKSKGDKIEELWVNVVLEGYRVGGFLSNSDMYFKLREVPVQRNSMNNRSGCKLGYNGRRFSDTFSENIGLLEIGIHYQILYTIINRTLELTIAKSKGKIFLIDINAIPKDENWDEAKFFYYAENLGFALLNRNQLGVDKQFTYQVMDMGLFDQINQLIQLASWCKNEWHSLLGITPARLGEKGANDLVGVNKAAIFQSSVMTRIVFDKFEELQQRELQGIIDFSKFVNVDGVKAMYNDDLFNTVLLNIDPNKYCLADLGIMVNSSSKEEEKKRQLEQLVQPMIQNGARASTVVDVMLSNNLAQLKKKLKQVEDIQDQIQQQNVQSETDRLAQADQRKKEFMAYQELLNADLMNKEYDRKMQLEQLKGEYQVQSFNKSNDDAEKQANIEAANKREMQRDKLEADLGKEREKQIQENIRHQQKVNLDYASLAVQKKQIDNQAELDRQALKTKQ